MEKLRVLIKMLDNFNDLSNLLINELTHEVEKTEENITVEILPRKPTDDTK